MISKVLPRELMTRWLGDESGFRGLVIAAIAGSLTPGGPFVQFPIVAALLKSGAGIAPLMTYISAWSLLGINRLFIFQPNSACTNPCRFIPVDWESWPATISRVPPIWEYR